MSYSVVMHLSVWVRDKRYCNTPLQLSLSQNRTIHIIQSTTFLFWLISSLVTYCLSFLLYIGVYLVEVDVTITGLIIVRYTYLHQWWLSLAGSFPISLQCTSANVEYHQMVIPGHTSLHSYKHVNKSLPWISLHRNYSSCSQLHFMTKCNETVFIYFRHTYC